MKNKIVYLSQLKEISILYPGDVYEVAELIIRLSDAKYNESKTLKSKVISLSRPTLYGLANRFERLADIPKSRVEEVFEAHGFDDLNVVVESD